jgi:hypothetical protein
MKAKGTTPRKALQRQPKPHSSPAPANYAAWKAQAMATLKGPSTMREREWVRLHIQGKTPEEAAQQRTATTAE